MPRGPDPRLSIPLQPAYADYVVIGVKKAGSEGRAAIDGGSRTKD